MLLSAVVGLPCCTQFNEHRIFKRISGIKDVANEGIDDGKIESIRQKSFLKQASRWSQFYTELIEEGVHIDVCDPKLLTRNASRYQGKESTQFKIPSKSIHNHSNLNLTSDPSIINLSKGSIAYWWKKTPRPKWCRNHQYITTMSSSKSAIPLMPIFQWQVVHNRYQQPLKHAKS